MFSGFLVLIPMARKSPESASSKNATVRRMSRTPGSPEEILTPIAIATMIVTNDCATTMDMSVSSLPNRYRRPRHLSQEHLREKPRIQVVHDRDSALRRSYRGAHHYDPRSEVSKITSRFARQKVA